MSERDENRIRRQGSTNTAPEGSCPEYHWGEAVWKLITVKSRHCSLRQTQGTLPDTSEVWLPSQARPWYVYCSFAFPSQRQVFVTSSQRELAPCRGFSKPSLAREVGRVIAQDWPHRESLCLKLESLPTFLKETGLSGPLPSSPPSGPHYSSTLRRKGERACLPAPDCHLYRRKGCSYHVVGALRNDSSA